MLQFAERATLRFPQYRDVVQPVCVAAYQCLHGVSLLAGLARQRLATTPDPTEALAAVESLLRYPTYARCVLFRRFSVLVGAFLEGV